MIKNKYKNILFGPILVLNNLILILPVILFREEKELLTFIANIEGIVAIAHVMLLFAIDKMLLRESIDIDIQKKISTIKSFYLKVSPIFLLLSIFSFLISDLYFSIVFLITPAYVLITLLLVNNQVNSFLVNYAGLLYLKSVPLFFLFISTLFVKNTYEYAFLVGSVVLFIFSLSFCKHGDEKTKFKEVIDVKYCLPLYLITIINVIYQNVYKLTSEEIDLVLFEAQKYSLIFLTCLNMINVILSNKLLKKFKEKNEESLQLRLSSVILFIYLVYLIGSKYFIGKYEFYNYLNMIIFIYVFSFMNNIYIVSKLNFKKNSLLRLYFFIVSLIISTCVFIFTNDSVYFFFSGILSIEILYFISFLYLEKKYKSKVLYMFLFIIYAF